MWYDRKTANKMVIAMPRPNIRLFLTHMTGRLQPAFSWLNAQLFRQEILATATARKNCLQSRPHGISNISNACAELRLRMQQGLATVTYWACAQHMQRKPKCGSSLVEILRCCMGLQNNERCRQYFQYWCTLISTRAHTKFPTIARWAYSWRLAKDMRFAGPYHPGICLQAYVFRFCYNSCHQKAVSASPPSTFDCPLA